MMLNPKEIDDHKALVRWVRFMEHEIPDLEYFMHYPASGFNIGAREKRAGSRAAVIQRQILKALGVLPDVSDFLWPVRRGRFSGLWMELKRRRGARVRTGQRRWLEAMEEQGFAVAVARGLEDAKAIILRYEGLGREKA